MYSVLEARMIFSVTKQNFYPSLKNSGRVCYVLETVKLKGLSRVNQFKQTEKQNKLRSAVSYTLPANTVCSSVCVNLTTEKCGILKR